MKLHGSIVAIVTPFHNGAICWSSYEKLVQRHLTSGTHGILVAGTTGEASTMSEVEYVALLTKTVALAGDKLPILAGTGSNSTAATIERTALAAKHGADVALVVTPYYNKPGQPWLVRHFTEVADVSPIPVLLYNVPSRTGVNMLPPAVIELSKHPNIIGIKEASGSCSQAADILSAVPDDFVVLSGDDKINYPLMAMGARGAISVVANVAPKAFSSFMDFALAQEWEKARHLYFKLLAISDGLFVETNPAPAKACLHLLEVITSPECRAPLYAASSETRERMSAIMVDLNLL